MLSAYFAGYSPIAQWPIYAGVLISAAHCLYLVNTIDYDNKQECMQGFIKTQWHILIILIGILLSNYLFSDEEKKRNKAVVEKAQQQIKERQSRKKVK